MTGEEPRAPLWPALVCATAAIALFARTIDFGFVYDDHRFVQANAALADPSILWRAFSDPVAQTADGTHAGLWRPLRTLSFALDRLLFGTDPGGGHLVNVLLHGLASGLVARLLQRFSFGALAAALGGLVYAAHPAQVECVAWISSRGDLLAAALVWAALVARGPRRPWRAWALGGAALLAKEQAVIWPALVVLTEVLEGRRFVAALRSAVVPLAIAGAFVLVRGALLDEPFQEGGLGRADVAEAGRMLAHQAWYVALPVGGVFDWQMPGAGGRLAQVVLGAVALGVVGAVAWSRTRAAASWFVVALVPTLLVQLVVPLNIRVADRFLLFALPAGAIFVARAVARDRRLAVASLVAIGSLATLSVEAQAAWRDDATLWTTTAGRIPGHWRAHVWLGTQALADDDVEAAVGHLREAARLAPQDGKTQFRLAEALERRAARAQGDDVVGATREASRAYAAAAACFGDGRQENAALLQPVARLRLLDLTLALGDVKSTAAFVTRWLDQGRPDIPAYGVPLWNEDLTRLIGHVEQHLDPELERPLAPYLREWLIAP